MQKFIITNAYYSFRSNRVVVECDGLKSETSFSPDFVHGFLRPFIGLSMTEMQAKSLKGSTVTCDEVKHIPAGSAWKNEKTGETGVYEQDRIELVNSRLSLDDDAVDKGLERAAKYPNSTVISTLDMEVLKAPKQKTAQKVDLDALKAKAAAKKNVPVFEDESEK